MIYSSTCSFAMSVDLQLKTSSDINNYFSIHYLVMTDSQIAMSKTVMIVMTPLPMYYTVTYITHTETRMDSEMQTTPSASVEIQTDGSRQYRLR